MTTCERLIVDETWPIRNYQWKDGKKVLDENGNGVPRKDCQRYRDALESGEAFWVETTGKHIYIYDLK